VGAASSLLCLAPGSGARESFYARRGEHIGVGEAKLAGRCGDKVKGAKADATSQHEGLANVEGG
jgi:hypothetical protein